MPYSNPNLLPGMDEQGKLGSVKKCLILVHSVLFLLFVCLFVYSALQRQVISSVSTNITNPSHWDKAGRNKKSLSLSRHAEAGSAKKHRAIRWDIVNILQSLYPWAIAWTASHKVMVSYGNCRRSFWSQYFLKVCAGQVCTNQSLFGVFIYTHFPEFYFMGEYLHCSPLAFSMLTRIFYHPVVSPFQCRNFVWTLSHSSHTKVLLHAKITVSINQFQLQVKFIIYLGLYRWGVIVILAIQLKHAWKVKTSCSFQSNKKKKNHCICPSTKQNQPHNLCIISLSFYLCWSCIKRLQ